MTLRSVRENFVRERFDHFVVFQDALGTERVHEYPGCRAPHRMVAQEVDVRTDYVQIFVEMIAAIGDLFKCPRRSEPLKVLIFQSASLSGLDRAAQCRDVVSELCGIAHRLDISKDMPITWAHLAKGFELSLGDGPVTIPGVCGPLQHREMRPGRILCLPKNTIQHVTRCLMLDWRKEPAFE